MPQLQQTVSGGESRAGWHSESAGGVTPPVTEAHEAVTARSGPLTAPALIATTRPTPNAPLLEELPAEARHVRPDELRAALTAIEARRGGAVVETIALGEALGDARAEVTPDEVWQEIYAQRNRARATRKVEDFENRRRRKRLFQSVGGVACLLTTAVALRFLVGDMGRAASNETAALPIKPPPSIPAARTESGASPYLTDRAPVQSAPVPQTQTPSGGSAVQTTPGQSPGLNGSVGNVTNPTGTVAGGTGRLGAASAGVGNLWQLTTRDGRDYLRCWADLPDGASVALFARPVTVYNRPDHPEAGGKSLRSLTVPLDTVTDLGGVEAEGFGRRQILLNTSNHQAGRAPGGPTNPPPPAPPLAPPAVVTPGGATGGTVDVMPGGPPRTRTVRDLRGGANRANLGDRPLASGETLKEVSPGEYVIVPPGASGGGD